MVKKSLYSENIDLLRAFAAISVLVYHVIELTSWKSFPIKGLLSWFRIGWMGVDLFFVISGFVITLSAFSILENNNLKRYRILFSKKRIARIVPLHYLTILVFLTFVMPAFLFERFWINLFSHLSFVHNLVPSLHGGINGPNWTIATEMQFYALILFLAPWLRITNVFKIILVFLAVSWFWKAGVIAYFDYKLPENTFPIFVYSTQLPGVLDEFLMGILIARFFKSNYSKNIISCFAKNNFLVYATFLIAFIFLYYVLIIFWSNSEYWSKPLMVVFFRTFLALSFAFIVFSACFLEFNKKVKFFFIPFSYLGKISYGIYLWHLPIILSLKKVEWLTSDKILILTLILTFIFSSISWHFFEKSFINRINKNR
jgi:peptidoglycan/LPS O-acetylase OafA/YrhL